MSSRTSLLLTALGGMACLAAAPSALAAGQVVFSFPPGDLQGWTQVTVPGGTDNDYRFFATNANFGNRIIWQDPTDGGIGGVVVTSDANFDARGSTHNTAVLRSPSFTLNGVNAAADIQSYVPNGISFRLLAGKGSPTGPANFAALPAAAVDNGSAATTAYLGVGLRRVSDGAYLLWGRRTSDAQSTNWQTVSWDQAALTAATSTDPAGTLYTLDFIDAGFGNWGWVAMDSVTLSYDLAVQSTVSVKPQDIIGAETGSDHQLSVRFSRDGSTTKALDVFYTVEGSAVEGYDYQTLPNPTADAHRITIPAGQATVDLPVNILSNGVTEIDRSVTIRLQSSTTYISSSAALVTTVWISDVPQTGLATVSGPMQTGTYLPFANPITASANGSLFFYGEGNYTGGGYMVLGVRPLPSDNSANGAVDLGRNNASSGNAIFNYLDNKGAASATARVPATTDVPINNGHFTMIGEIQFTTATTGTIRSWIWDGVNGSADYANPNVTTTFSNGFTNTGDQLYLRLDANTTTTTWTNARAIWAPAGTAATVFSQLTPTRPFVYVDAPTAAAGEYGANQDLSFSIFRSGPPRATALTVPLNVGGTAGPEDFSTYPSSAAVASGSSIGVANFHIVADNQNEGTEFVTVAAVEGSTWLLGMGSYASGDVLDRPYQAWMAANLPGSTDGPLTDSDLDGVTNLLEYFAGSGAMDATSKAAATLAPGTTATLRYPRQTGLSDVIGRVLWSADLVQWHASGESDGARTVNIAETVTSTDGQPDSVDAKATVTGTPASRLFLKLSVELP